MRKLIYGMFVSLDGFIEGPNREIDWNVVDEELHRFANDLQSETGASLFGRRMYEVMSYWDTADQNLSSPAYELEFARNYKRIPKIVFSKSLERVEGNARLVRGDVIEEVANLKAQSGKDLEIGGADLASTFIKAGMVDEYRLFIQPVVLGSGTPFFPAMDKPISLQLVETRTFGSGVVYLRYQQPDKRKGI